MLMLSILCVLVIVNMGEGGANKQETFETWRKKNVQQFTTLYFDFR